MTLRKMRRIVLFVVLFIVWYLVSWPYDFKDKTFDWQIFLAGIVVSFLLCLIFPEVIPVFPHKLFSLTRWYWALYYIPVFCYYLLKANLDVVYRVVHPRMPINPGIVKVKTKLTSDAGRTMLANSITLTPGTMTVDITDDGYLYIHWINVTDTEIEKATANIVAPFEEFLTKIFD
jgi:multicomponent Na+:H+ antiporter subunit E